MATKTRPATTGGVTTAHVFDEEHLTQWDADAVVLVTGSLSTAAPVLRWLREA